MPARHPNPRSNQTTSDAELSHALSQDRAAALRQFLNPPDDPRPLLLFFVGPNGAGKSSLWSEFFPPGTPSPIFINADQFNAMFGKGQFPAQDSLMQAFADAARAHCLQQGVSFGSESVFSDPAGAKLAWLTKAWAAGFRVTLIGVLLRDPHLSANRVAIRTAEGGHSVAPELLNRRFLQNRVNVQMALRTVERALIFDNSVDAIGPQLQAIVRDGKTIHREPVLYPWVDSLLPGSAPITPSTWSKPSRKT